MILQNIEFDWNGKVDYPEFCNCYISYAEDEEGRELTEEELEEVDIYDYYDLIIQTLV